eukprot:5738542-Amphidinium_carterae.1
MTGHATQSDARPKKSLLLEAEPRRSDPEFVLRAVKADGLDLQFAAPSCRADPEIVLAAVKQSGYALAWAGESCRGDRKIVMKAVVAHG